MHTIHRPRKRAFTREWCFVCGLLLGIVGVFRVAGADPALPPAATQPDLSNDRLAFLTLQLSSVEESLKAVNLAIKGTGYQAKVVSGKAEQYEKGNELMDRKGGGPMAWDTFYGRTADKFFYHPTDANTKYRFGNPGGKAPVPAPSGHPNSITSTTRT